MKKSIFKKNTFVILIVLMFVTTGYSQKSSFEVSKTKLNNALKYEDYITSIDAVHDILAFYPEKTHYKDSLLTLYIMVNQLRSATNLAFELETNGNKTNNVLDVMGNYYNKTGKGEKALPYFKELNKRNENLYYLNEIAILEFRLKKNEDCLNTLNKIISNKNSEKEKTAVNAGEGKMQEVPYAAVAYNIAGLMSLNLDNKEEAKQHFESALKIFPDFEVAKINLNGTNKK